MVIENEIADGGGAAEETTSSFGQAGTTSTTSSDDNKQAVGIEGMILRSDNSSKNDTAPKTTEKDKLKLKEEDYTILELPNGCICCTVKSLLLQSLDDLIHKQLSLYRHVKFDHIIIETSGLANPGPLVDSFWGVGNGTGFVRLDGG